MGASWRAHPKGKKEQGQMGVGARAHVPGIGWPMAACQPWVRILRGNQEEDEERWMGNTWQLALYNLTVATVGSWNKLFRGHTPQLQSAGRLMGGVLFGFSKERIRSELF